MEAERAENAESLGTVPQKIEQLIPPVQMMNFMSIYTSQFNSC